MSYDILKNLGLDHVDTGSPDFLKMLERMQREAWESLQRDDSMAHVESEAAAASAQWQALAGR